MRPWDQQEALNRSRTTCCPTSLWANAGENHPGEQPNRYLLCETRFDRPRLSSNWNTCQERVVAALSGACLLGSVEWVSAGMEQSGSVDPGGAL